MNKQALVAASLVFASVASATVQAQAPRYPDHPLRLIVPFPPGSLTDLVSRIAAQRLAAQMGQQVVVENRVGATGSIGVEAIAKASPDGYNLGLITASTHGLVPALSTTLPYDPVKDFKPVSMIGEAPYVMVVSNTIPAKTVSEMLAYAKSRAGQMNYGSAGIGSVAHLAAALLAQKAGVEMNHIPYKSTAQSSVDLIAGRLDMQIATVAPTLPAIRDGKMRALATTGKRRLAALPDVPTMMEAGVKDYIVTLWAAFVTPAGTPDAAVGRLNAGMNAILAEPETIEALRKQGVEPEASTPGAVTTRIRDEIAMWRALIAKTGIKVE